VRWSVVVPVKRVERAKTRLAGAVPGNGHEALVLALAADTVSAVLASAAVARVIVVTDDSRAAAELGGLGALVVPDLPDSGLNPALDHGAAAAAAAGPADGVAVVGADRPALRPAELAAVLALAAAHDRAFLPDTAGTGTALLTARAGVPLDPRFGPDSAAAHAASGAVRLSGEWTSLRHDTDTAADLGVARRLGLGVRTSAVLAAFGTGERPGPGSVPDRGAFGTR
jgi:2-phospho-L-lactate guanylyltransferase